MSICKNENCCNEFTVPPEEEYNSSNIHKYIGYCSRHCDSTDIGSWITHTSRPAKAGTRVLSLENLHEARMDRRSIICANGPFSRRPYPAACVLNVQGVFLLSLLRRGMWIYEKDKK